VANYAESIDTLLPNMQEVKPTLFLSVPRIFEKAYTRISEMMTNEGGAKLTAFRWALQVGKKWLEEKRAAKSGRAGITTELQYLAAKKIVFDKIKNRFGGKLRLTLSGGAPLPDSIADFMEMVGIPIYQGYGLTETCAPICVNTPLNNKPGTVGKLFPDVLVRIADDGEILVKSMKNFKGYYKDPESTNEAIRDGWFYTGDIGHLDDEGYLKITDRKKDLIKTAGGKFVAPQRIENIAKTSPIVNQIVVYGDQKPYITALVTLHQEAVIKFSKEKKLLASEFSSLIKSPDVAQLVSNAIEEINRQLPRWETIKRFHVLPMEFTVESGELTPSLKVKRKLLTKKYQDVLESLYIKK
jgi:long-chain acyl-CoA synthetase